MSDRAAEAGWQNGRFDGRAGQPKVLFGRMYEDSSIEIRAFARRGRIFAIASAGCTAITLSAHHEVVAVDINPAQLAYAARRIQGEPAALGTVELLMAAGRSVSPLIGWTRARLQVFLALVDPAVQSVYWQTHLDTRRFRNAFDALLSLTALRKIYASGFLDFLPAQFGAVLRTRVRRCIDRHPNADNPYLQSLLLGHPLTVEPRPRPEAITLVNADAADFLERQPAGSFDGFTLSNILDGAPAGYGPRLAAAVRHAAAPHAMMIKRSFRNPQATGGANHAVEDRAALWGLVEVCAVHPTIR